MQPASSRPRTSAPTARSSAERRLRTSRWRKLPPGASGNRHTSSRRTLRCGRARIALLARGQCGAVKDIGPMEHVRDVGPVEQVLRRLVGATFAERHLRPVLPDQVRAIEAGEEIGIGVDERLRLLLEGLGQRRSSRRRGIRKALKRRTRALCRFPFRSQGCSLSSLFVAR